MGGRREFHERALARPARPDVLTMLVFAQLSFAPTVWVGSDERAWMIPWMLFLLGVGLVMLRLDEVLVSVDSTFRWNDWGLAILDRSGRVTRSLAWSTVRSYRVDRCSGAPSQRARVVTLVMADRELSLGTMAGVGHVAVDPWTQRAILEVLTHRRVPELPSREAPRLVPPSAWTVRAVMIALAWYVSLTLLARWLVPSLWLGAAVLPALWIGPRVEPFLRAVRASFVGRGLRVARVREVIAHGLLIEEDGRESTIDALLVDPRDAAVRASAVLGRTSFARGDTVLVTPEPITSGYRSADGPSARSVVSVRDRRRARATVVMTLAVVLAVSSGAVLAASGSLRSLFPWVRETAETGVDADAIMQP